MLDIKEVNQLVASDGEEYDYFGISVAVSGDGLVAIVGAYSSDTKANDAGKVYTYSRPTINDNWVEVNQLTASDGEQYNFFGTSVALSSDGLVALVGAYGNNTKARKAGKVYTYSRDSVNDDWKEVNKLVANDGEARRNFGTSVALSSDGLVALVGGNGNDSAGKVYTYSRDTIDDNWKEVNQLLASDGKEFDDFGSSVALSSDGLVAIVGAHGSDTKTYGGGKVYTYSRDTIADNWVEVNQLVASDSKAEDHFGTSVTLSSDGLVAIVGADGVYCITTKAAYAGKVYTYSRATINDDWTEVNQLTASDTEECAFFGSSVALSSDGLVATVGASSNNTKGKSAGKVYTYTIKTNSK